MILSIQIDLQLEGSSLLWSQLEVGIETILKKAEMVEQALLSFLITTLPVELI